jgi:hypothetical protein
MTRLLLIALLLSSASAQAQIYRWVDAQGRTNFSNTAPPTGVKSTIVDADAREMAPAPVPENAECYTIRCQGERMEERQRKRQKEEDRMAEQRAAATPRPYRGLEFRKYISIQRGMSEGELVGIAGEPDFRSGGGAAIVAPTTVRIGRNYSTAADLALALTTYTYMPTSADPFTTTITLVGGRVSEIDRVRKF